MWSHCHGDQGVLLVVPGAGAAVYPALVGQPAQIEKCSRICSLLVSPESLVSHFNNDNNRTLAFVYPGCGSCHSSQTRS
jgi:hypothetical protein